MAFIADGTGGMEVGPPPDDDPIRQDNARMVRNLAWRLEMDVQEGEHRDSFEQQTADRLAGLESRLAMLEQLLLGSGHAA